MKTCSRCKKLQELENFFVNKAQKSGYSNQCKPCKRLSDAEYRVRNAEKVKERSAKQYLENREAILKRQIAHNSTKREELQAYSKEHYKNNKSMYRARDAKRRAAELKRTPIWADQLSIKAYYDVCAFFNEVNGYIKYHVDHKIPLLGKYVSGLHVNNNLQVILAKDNLKKGNKHYG